VPVPTEPAASLFSLPGDTVIRTPTLRTVTNYRFRLRTWSARTPSDWTAWAAPGTGGGSSGDTTPPGDPTGLTAAYTGLFDRVDGSWVNSASTNIHHTEVYRADTTTFTDSVLIYTSYVTTASAAATFSDPENGRSTGSWWIKAFNGSGYASNLVGPFTL
jgi:hypothetical protein